MDWDGEPRRPRRGLDLLLQGHPARVHPPTLLIDDYGLTLAWLIIEKASGTTTMRRRARGSTRAEPTGLAPLARDRDDVQPLLLLQIVKPPTV